MMPDPGPLADVPAMGMLHALNIPAWLMTPDGTEQVCNQKLIETLPLALEPEAVRLSHMHPDDLRVQSVRLQEGLQKGEAFTMPYRVMLQGQYQWFESTLSPIRHHGQTVAWLGTLRKLEDTGLYLQALMDNAPVGVSFMDETYHLKVFNQQLLKDGHHTQEEFSQRSFAELSPDVFQLVKPHIDHVFQTAEISTLELESTLTQEPSWWQVTYFPVKMGHEVIGVGAISQNITPVKQALRELEEQKTFLQRITDAVPATIGLTDLTTGKQLFANEYSFSVLGYTREEFERMSPQDVWDLFPAEDQPHLQETARRVHHLGEGDFLEQEYRIRHKDGHLVWIWGRTSIFSRSETGEPLSYLSTSVMSTEVDRWN